MFNKTKVNIHKHLLHTPPSLIYLDKLVFALRLLHVKSCNQMNSRYDVSIYSSIEVLAHSSNGYEEWKQ